MANMVQALVEEREKAVALIAGLTDQAADEGRDLSDQDVTVIKGKQERIGQIDGQLELLTRDVELADEAKQRIESLSGKGMFKNSAVEYRTAGAWLTDAIAEAKGDKEARERLQRYNRAADHIKTSDTPGIVPDPILGPILDFIDARRPLTSAVGITAIPNGPTFHRPVLTDAAIDTGGMGKQAAEKDELASAKFTITRRDVSVDTYGGYVNVSRQDLDWGQGTMDLVVNQLAKRYARMTEKALVAELETSTSTESYDATTNTDPSAFQAAVYNAAAQYYSDTGELPSWLATDPTGWAHLGGLADAAKRPAFPFLAPSNAGGTQAADSFAGNPIGLSLVVSYAVSPGTFIVGGSESVSAYEQRIGTLQVVEPSVLGVQVAYAGYFAADLGNAKSAVLLKP